VSAAESRGLAEEQAALRRLATLVAAGAPSEEVFAAATEEVGRLLLVDYLAMSRFESDRVLAYVASWSATAKPIPPVGTRVTIGGNNVNSLVFETGRPARIDSYADGSGPLARVIRDGGVRSAVGAPIIVEGRVWGAFGIGSVAAPLPLDTEARLTSFTELLATAIANAESRAGLARLAEEQAALRRVATLVAESVPPEEVFAAVTDEVARLLAVQTTRMGRYESDGTVTFVAASGMTDAFFPAGSRLILGGRNVSTLVAQTGRSARIDDYADASGPIGETIRENGLGSAVGTPITVDGGLWGVMAVASTLKQSLPPDTEARLAQFTELLATAVANAESRAGLIRLAEEQAALLRVATLVAQGVPQEELFAAVTEEVVRVLPVDIARMGRYESDDTFTYVAASGTAGEVAPVSTPLKLGGKNLATMVFETGRPARLNNFADATGPIGAALRLHDPAVARGVGSAVATPITVEGRLWGVVIASSSSLDHALARDTEPRLIDFTALVAMAIANTQSRVELTASRARIIASRARLVSEAHEARRGVVRDLHDGAQQGLVHTIIALKLARRALDRGQPDPTALVSEALGYAETANDELRELVHGILPAVLTREGLRAGVDELAARMSIPVHIDIAVERLPPVVEATAYFVVAGALTNVLKHAHAERAAVRAFVTDETLHLEVRDDGVGGANPRGPGVVGLSDRVTALEGRLSVESPPEGGTILAATLPLDSN
jgi:signal transduction histidine kinase